MSDVKTLALDLETYSSADLNKTGVYKYVASPDFEILLFGYSVNGGPVQVVDVAAGEEVPAKILAALTDDSIEKWAYNAQFERVCLSAWLRKEHPERFKSYGNSEDSLGNYLSPYAWKCSRVWGAYMGLPMSLKGIGAVLKLDEQKMSEGADLIKYFCQPCKPTKKNGGRTRNFYYHDADKWAIFKSYNKRDVEVELGIKARLAKFPVPDFIWDEYHIDQEINDRGILLDMTLVEHAIALDAITKESLTAQLQDMTGLDNPNSVSQMKDWLSWNGVDAESLDKKAVKELLSAADDDVVDVLSCRQQLAKSSVSKYKAMENAVCADGRARGMFSFYGANRTGRWSGKIVQLQNLPQNHMEDLAEARALVRDGNFEALELLYDNIPGVLSELIRTAFVPKPGYKYVVADFSAIEARVLSFLAQEQWRMDLFARGGDIYCQSASEMFKVPVVKNGINGELRQKGKIAELACIAEGSLVLTDKGLVPIEHVTTDMRVWDGYTWNHHDGVIYKGEREVITYEGLSATPDHLVWVEGKKEPIQLGLAAACGAKLVRTGRRKMALLPIRHKKTKVFDNSGLNKRVVRVYDIRNAGPYHRFTVSDCLVHNCGYGGSVGALTAMGALDMGLKEEELQPLVDAWRAANPNIVKLWWEMDRAVKKAVTERTTVRVSMFKVYCQSGMLFIDLPSGRRLSYVKPKIGVNKFGSESVTYEGTNTGKWMRLESYGPKFTENLTQAVARDILAYAMNTLRDCFIVGSVHDELIIECRPEMNLKEICEKMGQTPPWIEGLLLRADGYECQFYRKD